MVMLVGIGVKALHGTPTPTHSLVSYATLSDLGTVSADELSTILEE